jgi:hypothetical protein
MSAPTETLAVNDVLDELIRQHGEIRDLFIETLRATGTERAQAFARLVRLLAVHETVEQEILHPLARRTFPGGAGIIEDRLAEEHAAEAMLAELDAMEPDDPAFEPLLEKLRTDALTHARAEERLVFVRLRAHPAK